jgi:hypothetical protein
MALAIAQRIFQLFALTPRGDVNRAIANTTDDAAAAILMRIAATARVTAVVAVTTITTVAAVTTTGTILAGRAIVTFVALITFVALFALVTLIALVAFFTTASITWTFISACYRHWHHHHAQDQGCG